MVVLELCVGGDKLAWWINWVLSNISTFVGIRKWFSSMASKLFVGCGCVIRALIDMDKNLMKSRCLGSIMLLKVARGASTSLVHRKEISMCS